MRNKGNFSDRCGALFTVYLIFWCDWFFQEKKPANWNVSIEAG